MTAWSQSIVGKHLLCAMNGAAEVVERVVAGRQLARVRRALDDEIRRERTVDAEHVQRQSIEGGRFFPLQVGHGRSERI